MDYYVSSNDDKVIQAAFDKCGEVANVKVVRDKVPGGNFIQKVLQLSSSKSLPDILMLDNPELQEIAKTGALVELKEYGISGDGYAEGIIKAGTYNDKLYGVAPEANTISLFYNTQIFDKAGLQPPKTWEELRTTAKALTEGDQYGIAFSAIANYEGTWQFMPFFWTAGADEANIDSPEAAKALQFWVDLMADGSISKGALNWTQGDVMEQFSNGKAAMMVNGPWQIPDIKDKYPNLKWDIVPIPALEEGGQSVSPLGGEVWTLTQSTDRARQTKAAEVLQCFLSDENQIDMGIKRWTVPGKMGLREKYLKQMPEMQAFTDQVSTARSRTGEIGDRWSKTAEAIYTAMQVAMTGQAKPEEALKSAAATLK